MIPVFEIIFTILYYLLWPLLIIGGIIFIIRRKLRGGDRIEKKWYDKSFFSKEDFVSQFFILFSVILFNIAFWIVNYQAGEIVSGTTVFLISSLLGVVVGYYFRVIWTFVLSTIGLIMWWFYQATIWSNQINNYNSLSSTTNNGSGYTSMVMRQFEAIKPITLLSAFIFIAIIFYLFGRMLERKEQYKRLAKFYSSAGLVSITGFLFIFSSNYGIGVIGNASKGSIFFGSLEITISFAIFLGALAVLLIYSFKEKLIFFSEAAAIGILAIFFLILVLLPEQVVYTSSSGYSYSRNFSGIGIFWAMVFNALVFFEILGIVFLGYLRRQNLLINLGAVFLFLLIIVKYLDWFGNLAAGAFLIGAGVLLFVVGWSMEKGRRYMISKIKN